MKVVFYHFSNLFFKGELNHSEEYYDYYDNIYKYRNNNGYYNNEHFFEIPIWMAYMNHVMVKHKIESEVYYITNIDEAIKHTNECDYDFIMISSMDINSTHINKLIKNSKNISGKIIVGGYSKPEGDDIWVNSLEEAVKNMNINFEGRVDIPNYSIFKGLKIIPRLTLSTGCENNCSFCTISKSPVIELSEEEVWKQIDNILGILDFKLIYIDDKTFGQCNNWKMLKYVGDKIKEINPQFEGFIIQTSANYMRLPEFVSESRAHHVRIAEVGFESYNKEVVRFVNKCHNVKDDQTCINNAYEYDVKLIGNFIIGLPKETKETYLNTLNFIDKNISKFYILNIYNLAVYTDTKLSKILNITSESDKNEMIKTKSLHTEEENINAKNFETEIYKLGNQILKKKGF